eukprot:m.565276 g.565276  ORF g.565276 m.565276 type:complete len:487 (-) comp57823_c0_seq2:37-1497(-)
MRLLFAVGAMQRRVVRRLSAVPRTSKVLVLAGPTSVGKTRVSIQLAKQLNGEIISADSMQVYEGMDIGTDKVSADVRKSVRHHLIDIINIRQSFSAGDFAARASQAITEITERGKTPIVVGGTAFYLQMLMHGAPGTPASDEHTKAQVDLELQGKSWDEAILRLTELDPVYAVTLSRNDWFRLKRALCIVASSGRPVSSFKREARLETKQPVDFRPFFLNMDRQDLFAAIDARCERLLFDGLIEETIRLLSQGLQSQLPCAKGLGYQQVLQYLDHEWFGNHTISNARESRAFHSLLVKFQAATRQFARKQIGFFRTQPEYHWITRTEEHDEELASGIARSFHLQAHKPNATESARTDRLQTEQADMASYATEHLIYGDPSAVQLQVRKVRKLLAITFPEMCGHLYDLTQRKRWEHVVDEADHQRLLKLEVEAELSRPSVNAPDREQTNTEAPQETLRSASLGSLGQVKPIASTTVPAGRRRRSNSQ